MSAASKTTTFWSFPMSCLPLRPFPAEATPEAQEAVWHQFEKPELGVTTRAGSIVHLDLAQPAGRRLLSSVTGPVSLSFRQADGALVTELAALAARVPVGLTLYGFDDLSFLEQLGDVVALHVEWCRKDLGPITHLRRLASLHLGSVVVTPVILEHLARCPDLYQLSTYASEVGPLSALARLTGLRSLRLHRLEDSTELCHLVGMDRLGHLELKIASCAHADLLHLGELANLRYLKVCVDAFRVRAPDESAVAAIAAIASRGRLERLTLRYDEFDAEPEGPGDTATSIALPALRELELYDWPGQWPFLHRLAAPGLTSLNVGGGDGPTQLAAVARFSTVEELWLTNFVTKIDDEDLIALRDLGALHMLSLYSANIGDAGLAHVAGLPLTYLNVSGSRVGDAGLAHLATMTTLRDLDLTSTAVTDAAGAHLAVLKRLERLTLRSTAIGDRTLKHLATLGQLRALELSRTKVTDAGLAHLATLTRLEELHLDRAKITDAGMAHLGKLTSLQVLSVREVNNVTNEGVLHLESLPHLRSLNISSEHDLDEAEGRLHALRPNLFIDV